MELPKVLYVSAAGHQLEGVSLVKGWNMKMKYKETKKRGTKCT